MGQILRSDIKLAEGARMMSVSSQSNGNYLLGVRGPYNPKDHTYLPMAIELDPAGRSIRSVQLRPGAGDIFVFSGPATS